MSKVLKCTNPQCSHSAPAQKRWAGKGFAGLGSAILLASNAPWWVKLLGSLGLGAVGHSVDVYIEKHCPECNSLLELVDEAVTVATFPQSLVDLPWLKS